MTFLKMAVAPQACGCAFRFLHNPAINDSGAPTSSASSLVSRLSKLVSQNSSLKILWSDSVVCLSKDCVAEKSRYYLVAAAAHGKYPY